jgi:hypothetical protein
MPGTTERRKMLSVRPNEPLNGRNDDMEMNQPPWSLTKEPGISF